MTWLIAAYAVVVVAVVGYGASLRPKRRALAEEIEQLKRPR
jgi:CcmD family protein